MAITIQPIHLFELAVAGTFGYLAVRNLQRARENDERAAAPANALVAGSFRTAAASHRSSALTTGVLAAGILGLTLYTWNDPWAPLVPRST